MSTTTPIELKKHAYRQTQDGIVISFVVHPNDMPAALATAGLGTRYMAAFVEIGDDEKPVERPESVAMPEPAPKADTPVKAGPKSYAQRIGILCNNAAFRRFLAERYWPGSNIAVLDGDMAADTVRDICGVASRRDILPGSAAGEKWCVLEIEYQNWLSGTDPATPATANEREAA